MTIREEVREKFGVELEQVAANYADKFWKMADEKYGKADVWIYFFAVEPQIKEVVAAVYLAGFKDLAEVIGRKYE